VPDNYLALAGQATHRPPRIAVMPPGLSTFRMPLTTVSVNSPSWNSSGFPHLARFRRSAHPAATNAQPAAPVVQPEVYLGR
jgi:hypothetical protein